MVQVYHDGLKLNGTHKLLVRVDDVNLLGGSAHTIKKNAEALVFASKETGLEVNADKTKDMVRSPDQKAGRSHSIKIDNILFNSVE
jgi:CTP:molybdopterin cytidylyltransferase MocA